MHSSVFRRGHAPAGSVCKPIQTIAQEQSATPEKDNPPHYAVIDLGPVGNSPGQPYGISNDGLIIGAAAASDGALHGDRECCADDEE